MSPNAPGQRQSAVPVWPFVVLGVVLVVLFFGAVLALLAVSGVRRYIAASKTAEATSQVAMLGRDAADAYGRRGMLCKSATTPVPTSIVAVQGKKYMASSSEWRADPADRGFTCLGFETGAPQYYQYDYQEISPDELTAIARGDLDGDGVTSEFTQRGHVVAGTVVLDTKIERKNEDE